MLAQAPVRSTPEVVASLKSAIENDQESAANEILRQYSHQIDFETGIEVIDMAITKNMLTVITMTVSELKTKINQAQSDALRERAKKEGITVSELKEKLTQAQADAFLARAATEGREAVVKCLLAQRKKGLYFSLNGLIQAQLNALKSCLEQPLLPNASNFANIHRLIGNDYFFYTDQLDREGWGTLEKMNQMTRQYNGLRLMKKGSEPAAAAEQPLVEKISIPRDF